MLASHCSTSGQGWPMKLNGGTRPVLSSVTSNSRGSGTRGGFSGRLTLVYFLLLLFVAFLLLAFAGFFSSGLGCSPPGCGWGPCGRRGLHHRFHLLGRGAGRDREHGLLSENGQPRRKQRERREPMRRCAAEYPSRSLPACATIRIPQ